ncbi:hypothetical protein Tco_0303792 [Tanacetum coccineum]
MSSSSKSTHDYSRKLRRAILEPWRQSHNLPPSPPPNRNTPTSHYTTNSSPSLSLPQNSSPNQIIHELHHLSNLLEINLQHVIDATNSSPPTSPCISPPSLNQTLGGSGCKSFWEEGDDFGVDVLGFHTCLTDILGFLEKLEWWFKQYIDDEGVEDEEGDGGSEV